LFFDLLIQPAPHDITGILTGQIAKGVLRSDLWIVICLVKKRISKEVLRDENIAVVDAV